MLDRRDNIIEAPPYPAALTGLAYLVRAAIDMLERFPYSIIALAARLFPATVFWRSGQTKIDGWQVSDNALELFREEYKLPFVDPAVMAHVTVFAELCLPPLLIIGFASRFVALALLGMTLVIEVFVYPHAWPTHGTWAACFLLVIARGPGAISIDAQIERSRPDGSPDRSSDTSLE